ncbi:MAG TPA: heparinase II/III family protein [Xanthobacteraceae bacterium]
MSRVSAAERARLSLFLAHTLLRRLLGRITANSFVSWLLSFGKPDRLVIAPQDLRTADATRASEIYAGRFAFAGKIVVCDARSPFDMAPPTEDWAVALFGFGWLRHLRAADSSITRSNARALLDEWMSATRARNAYAWRADVMARRILSWLSQSPLLLDDSDPEFYRRFMRSLARQVRQLRHTMGDARDGVPRLQASIALMYAALCMAGQQRQIRPAAKRLNEELTRQILPDGGHISRNPGALVELLLDLLPLRTLFTARNIAPPAALLNAIDRMMPMLRFFRHGDGNLALFNGMGPTPADLLTTILVYDDARGAPLTNAPHSGYQRVENGGSLVVMDTGGPAPFTVSQEAHAGCLAFEFSTKSHRIVVNCGVPVISRDNWRQPARATAAHSTATLNDTSSCGFLESRPIRRMLQGVPIVGGPRKVTITREEHPSGIVLRSSHDGYAEAFNIVHHRALVLSKDGQKLDGEDLFMPARGEAPVPGKDQFAVRFHLHPSIKANRLADGHSAMLLMPNKEVWTFDGYEDPVDIEESVYLAGAQGPRRTSQIVIYGRARKAMRVQWTLAATPSGAPVAPARRTRGEEPELPL